MNICNTPELGHLGGSALLHTSLSSTEPDSEGPDRFWASGCQGDAVFSPEKICPQRPGCTQLHVSVNHELMTGPRLCHTSSHCVTVIQTCKLWNILFGLT